MTDSSRPGDAAEGDLAALGDALVAAVAATLPGWVERSLRSRADVGDDVVAAVSAAVTGPAVTALRRLVDTDIDRQTTTPLAVVRAAAVPITEALAPLGIAPQQRDPYDATAFPRDVYAIGPASWADIDPGPDLAEAALRWGVAKAFEHRRRHRG